MVSASLLVSSVAAFTSAVVIVFPDSAAAMRQGNATTTQAFDREIAPFNGAGREPCWYNKNSDRSGFDLANKPGKTYYACDDLCRSQEGCQTWSWTDFNGGTCWLKSVNGMTTPKSGAVSLSCSIASVGNNYVCRPYENIDFVGNDIGNKRGAPYDCCGFCDQTPGCSAYAWNGYNGGTCYLKSSVGHVVYVPGVISSSTKPLWGPVCPFEYDTDFVGKDIGNKPAKDAGVCCSQCKENKDCKAYTWSNYNGGTCWMKSGKGESKKAAGVISAALFDNRGQ